MIELTLFLFQKRLQIIVNFYPSGPDLHCLITHVEHLPLVLFDKVMVRPDLIRLVQPVLFDQPPMLFQLILTVLQRYQFMLALHFLELR